MLCEMKINHITVWHEQCTNIEHCTVNDGITLAG